MIPSDLIGAVLVLAAAYCVGGLHGLWLAWTQETRMKRWADWAAGVQQTLIDAEERGKNR